MSLSNDAVAKFWNALPNASPNSSPRCLVWSRNVSNSLPKNSRWKGVVTLISRAFEFASAMASPNILALSANNCILLIGLSKSCARSSSVTDTGSASDRKRVRRFSASSITLARMRNFSEDGSTPCLPSSFSSFRKSNSLSTRRLISSRTLPSPKLDANFSAAWEITPMTLSTWAPIHRKRFTVRRTKSSTLSTHFLNALGSSSALLMLVTTPSTIFTMLRKVAVLTTMSPNFSRSWLRLFANFVKALLGNPPITSVMFVLMWMRAALKFSSRVLVGSSLTPASSKLMATPPPNRATWRMSSNAVLPNWTAWS